MHHMSRFAERLTAIVGSGWFLALYVAVALFWALAQIMVVLGQ